MKKQKVQAKINLETLAGGAFAEKLKNYLVKALADVPDREKITIIA